MWGLHSRRATTIVAALGVASVVAGLLWLSGADSSTLPALTGLGSGSATGTVSDASAGAIGAHSDKLDTPADTATDASGHDVHAQSVSPGPSPEEVSTPEGADETTKTGLTLVELERVEVPESYDALLYFAGWHEDIRMPVVRVEEVELLGVIDPLTGEAGDDAQAGAVDHSADLVGIWVMAEPSARAAQALREVGTYRARLVLMPGEGAVVPRIDRAIGE
jgi:hypothetical protein